MHKLSQDYTKLNSRNMLQLSAGYFWSQNLMQSGKIQGKRTSSTFVIAILLSVKPVDCLRGEIVNESCLEDMMCKKNASKMFVEV